MKGFTHAALLSMLFLTSLSLFLAISAKELFVMGKSALEMEKTKIKAKEELLKEWKKWRKNPEDSIFEERIYRDKYTLRVLLNFFTKENFVLYGKTAFVKGQVPLSIFPDLQLTEFPGPKEIVSAVFEKPHLVPIKPHFYKIEGKRSGLYVNCKAEISGNGSEILINAEESSWKIKDKFIFVDGECHITGTFFSTLIACSGKVKASFIDASRGIFLISANQGFFIPGKSISSVEVNNSSLFNGEILAENITLSGNGTLVGGIQCLRVEGRWKHKKRPFELDFYPRQFFYEEVFAYEMLTLVKLER